ncbi:hypothetical protein PJ747_004596 [Escherichia coli]|nr:hypothetical protein [Escherichia coli]
MKTICRLWGTVLHAKAQLANDATRNNHSSIDTWPTTRRRIKQSVATAVTPLRADAINGE